jgi:hypothetical protein
MRLCSIDGVGHRFLRPLGATSGLTRSGGTPTRGGRGDREAIAPRLPWAHGHQGRARDGTSLRGQKLALAKTCRQGGSCSTKRKSAWRAARATHWAKRTREGPRGGSTSKTCYFDLITNFWPATSGRDFFIININKTMIN